MHYTKRVILNNLKNPITIKELQGKVGLKWSNLSKHLKDLTELGLVMQIGTQGKSKVIQINKINIFKYIQLEEDILQEMRLP